LYIAVQNTYFKAALQKMHARITYTLQFRIRAVFPQPFFATAVF